MPTLSKGLEQRGRSESGADSFGDVKRLRPTQGKESKITDYVVSEEQKPKFISTTSGKILDEKIDVLDQKCKTEISITKEVDEKSKESN